MWERCKSGLHYTYDCHHGCQDDGNDENLTIKERRRVEAVGILNDWVLEGSTQEERQRRTDQTWRLMEDIDPRGEGDSNE